MLGRTLVNGAARLSASGHALRAGPQLAGPTGSQGVRKLSDSRRLWPQPQHSLPIERVEQPMPQHPESVLQSLRRQHLER